MTNKLAQRRNWLFYLLGMLLLAACEKQPQQCNTPSEAIYNYSNFTKVDAGETFKINITKDAAFSIKAKGCANDLAHLDISVVNGFLKIKYNTYNSNRNQVEIDITMPSLLQLNLSGAARCTATGFQHQTMANRAVISGVAEYTLHGAALNTYIDASGTAKLTVTGSTESLAGNLSGASQLQAYNLQSKEADIATSGTAKAYVQVQQMFFAQATGASRIYYKGNPTVKEIETSGTAKVIQE